MGYKEGRGREGEGREEKERRGERKASRGEGICRTNIILLPTPVKRVSK